MGSGCCKASEVNQPNNSESPRPLIRGNLKDLTEQTLNESTNHAIAPIQ